MADTKDTEKTLRASSPKTLTVKRNVEQGVVRLDSVSGDVSLGVRRGVAVWLDLDSASGHVRSDLGAAPDVPSDGRPVLELRGRTVSGDLRVTPVEV